MATVLQDSDDEVINDVWQYSQSVAAATQFSAADLNAHLQTKEEERLTAGPARLPKGRYSLSAGFSAVPSPVGIRQPSTRTSLAPTAAYNDTFNVGSRPTSSAGAATASTDMSYMPDPTMLKTPRQALSFMGSSMLDTPTGGSFALATGNLGDFGEATTASGVPKVFESFEAHVRQQNACADPLRMAKEFAHSCQEELEILEQMQTQSQQYLPTQKLNQLCQSGSHLREEKHVWQLAHALYGDRLEGTPDSEACVTDYVMNKMSEKDIAKALFDRDSMVRESQMVVDWLENAAREKLAQIERVEFFSDIVCWENTQHELKMSRDGNQPIPSGLVTELDPDVAIRQKKALSDDDVRDERRLLRQVFAFIRAGQLQEAQDLCRKCGESWRAADLEGWNLFHDPNYSGKGGAVAGNPYRDVWKYTCWQSANADGYSPYERAIVAAYSGNLEKLLPVCESWEDCLWGYFKTLVDVQVEEEIRLVPRLDGRPWEPLPEGYGDKNLSPSAVFDELATNPSESMRQQAAEPFHVIERHLVLNDVAGLLNSFHDWIENHPHMNHHLLRCMAHVILFMRMLNQHMETTLCDEVLEAYIQSLIQDKLYNLVATYTACLSPALQVRVYASFLEGIEEKDEKRSLLDLAEKAGLDVAKIAKLVVENIRCRGADELRPDMETAQTSLTEADERRIAALDWLVFEKSQRSEAVHQACALIRSFLATKKHVAARAVLDKVPSGSLHVIQEEWKTKTGSTLLPAEDENSIHELTGLEAYLLALSSFDEWFRHYYNSKPAEPTRAVSSFTEQVALEQENKQYQVDLQRWEYALQACTQDAVQKIYAVLMFQDGWLQDVRVPSQVDSSREQQLLLLRRLCLPSLCFLLVKILKTTKHGRECLQVSEVVASEEYGLYALFQKSELKQFLQEVQQASTDILRTGLEDPLGYDV
ncbi:nuclear pore complex protein Nup107-like [Sycon ciliatum]|uniref:nuclear pore complex protein Nup107-like n=1 Tax=Sycon ciliatum TaxID=27933 RepID=UPI0031F5F412